jgi:hypothetical protein
MATESVNSQSTLAQIRGELAFPLGIFASVGLGIGLTTIVILSELGGGGDGAGLVTGFFSLMVIVVALSMGPVLAAIVGLHMARRPQAPGYVPGATGCAIGYLVMVFIVLVSLAIAIPSSGGSSGGGGGGFDIVGWLVPVIAVMLPTGGVAAVSIHLGSD